MTRRKHRSQFNLTVAAGLVGLVLTGCSIGPDRDLARPHTDDAAFMHHLAAMYDDLAATEARNFDWIDANIYAEKAARLKNGRHVAPAQLSAWRVPDGQRHELQSARGNLLTAFADGGKLLRPKTAASAQRNFDCWVEESEENWQTGAIRACRSGFVSDLTILQNSITAIGRVPPEAPRMTLHFETDQSGLNPAAARQLQQQVENFAADAGAPLIIVGHADNTGTDAYNNRLSDLRAEAAEAALKTTILAPLPIRRIGLGERSPQIWHRENQAERRNRRVEIIAPSPSDSD